MQKRGRPTHDCVEVSYNEVAVFHTFLLVVALRTFNMLACDVQPSNCDLDPRYVKRRCELRCSNKHNHQRKSHLEPEKACNSAHGPTYTAADIENLSNINIVVVS